MNKLRRAPAPRRLGPVDLAVCLVFAALCQGLWVACKMAGALFPYNHVCLAFAVAFCLAGCLTVAARRLASAAFTLGWVCINCLAQGEHPIYFACVLVLPLLPELLLAARSRRLPHPDQVFRRFGTLWLPVVLYTVLYFWWNFLVIYTVRQVAVHLPELLLAFLLAVPAALLGALAGAVVFHPLCRAPREKEMHR